MRWHDCNFLFYDPFPNIVKLLCLLNASFETFWPPSHVKRREKDLRAVQSTWSNDPWRPPRLIAHQSSKVLLDTNFVLFITVPFLGGLTNEWQVVLCGCSRPFQWSCLNELQLFHCYYYRTALPGKHRSRIFFFTFFLVFTLGGKSRRSPITVCISGRG